ncbi:MAG TPA: sulfite exporter TauE/SafE family protein, partial [Planctomycetaceae bacterium]|nr:sulfite exporter TauE/SafE family protein [Planctomycetaceae bacterium]
MHDFNFLWLCVTALIAGAVNSIAGGGTLITFPALLAALTPVHGASAAVLANATSTVALVPGSFAAAWGYRQKLRDARRWLALLIVPSLVGGVIGSLLLTRLSPAYFDALVPWLILTATLLLLIDSVRRRKPAGPERTEYSRRSIVGLVAFQLVVSIYGGYFGAGIGILMLASLAMMGIGDINRMNAVKTVLTVGINGVSVVVFLIGGDVLWQYALPMAAASILGGYLGAKLALRVHPRQVR